MTPNAALETLSRLVPGFAAHWAKGSLFIREDGTFSPHGVFAECSAFVREEFPSLSKDSIEGLLAFVNDAFEGRYGEEISNAAATCFLENLAGETFHSQLAACLRSKARNFYDGVIGV